MRGVASQLTPTLHEQWTWTATLLLGVDRPPCVSAEARGARSGARCSSFICAPAAIARPYRIRIANALLRLKADVQLCGDSFHAPSKSSGLG